MLAVSGRWVVRVLESIGSGGGEGVSLDVYIGAGLDTAGLSTSKDGESIQTHYGDLDTSGYVADTIMMLRLTSKMELRTSSARRLV